MKPSNTTKPSTKLHVMLNLTFATSTGVCNTGTSALSVCNLLLWTTTNNTDDATEPPPDANFETWMRGWGGVWLGIVYKDADVVSAVVLWRRTITRNRTPWYIADRRTAGIKALPHYHQLLVGEQNLIRGSSYVKTIISPFSYYNEAEPREQSDWDRFLPSGKKASS